jgi:PAS domain S-box-containing protein
MIERVSKTDTSTTHGASAEGSDRERGAEAALRTSELALKSVERVAHLGHWAWHIASNRLEWSEEMFRIFGIDPLGFTGDLATVVAKAIHPEDRDAVERANRSVTENGKPEPLEYRVVLPDGTVRVVWGEAGELLKDREGHPAILTGIVQDVTARKQVEAAQREAERASAHSHELLANLAQLVPGVIYEYRLYPDGRSAFPYASPGMKDIYEVTPEEVREDATPVFGRIHPDDLDRVAASIMENSRTLETFYSEFRVCLPRQGLRWRWCEAHPVRTEDGGTLWRGIISDITDRKKAEEERAKLQEQLHQSQKIESVGRLAGGIAHDFNNMLGVILGYTDLAMEQLDPNLPVHADLKEVRKAAQRSADLTRQLLAFARKQPSTPKVLDLNETVAGMLTMLQRLIGENVQIELVRATALWPVRVDPTQIDQILANLCVNGRDAITGAGKLTIETRNCTVDEERGALRAEVVPGDYVRLAVSDDGVGMNEDVREHLFEPFFTTKKMGEGTGLGLATVHGIVKQNLGFIEVESEPGAGTTFAIHLPRHSAHGDAARPPDSAEPGAPGRGTILLVEDEPAVLNLTRRMLEQLGYEVLTAGTPGEALVLAREHQGPLDLLLTDVVMPQINGRELATSLRASHPQLKRLFMSGYTADMIAHQGVVDEGLDFIQKPFSSRALAAKLRQVLTGSGGAGR